MYLTEVQIERLIARWEYYLERQEASGDNQYGSTLGQMAVLRKYLSPPATVVFIGCGDGLEVVDARREGYDAYGVSLGDPDVQRAKRVHGIDIVKADAHLLPEEWADKFDAALGFQVLEHSISGFLYLWEMRRILKPGGRVFAEVPSPDFCEDINWHHTGSPTPEQMRGWSMKLGFEAIEADYVDNVPHAARWAYLTAVKGKARGDMPL